MTQRRRRAERPNAAARNRADREYALWRGQRRAAVDARESRKPGEPCPLCAFDGEECSWCVDDREDQAFLDLAKESA